MKLTQFAFLIGSLALASGCTSSSSSGGGTGGSHGTHTGNHNDASAPTGDAAASTPTPSTATAHIHAAAGGEVSLSDGAGIVIPAGALNADTDITITSRMPASSLPDQASLQGLTYDFGPNGTTFNDPVALTLPLTGTPGADEQAVVSWLNTDTNKWEDLTTTTSNGKVTAETTHFTVFIVRFAGVAAGVVTCDFASCTGGNIVGTWDIQGACIDFPNPYESLCATATFDFQTSFTGTATFNADGTSSSTITTGGSIALTFPVDCLAQLTMGSTEVVACQDILGGDGEGDGGDGPTLCTGDTTTGCDCTKMLASKTEESAGTYTLEGSTLSTIDTGDTEADVSEVCVSGNSLKAQKVETKDGGIKSITWTAVRQ